MDRVLLHKPETGKSAQVAVQPGRVYCLDFELAETTVDNANTDVRLVFDDGAEILFQDFLRVTAHDDFLLELPDGAQLSGRDVAAMLRMDIQDFRTDGLAELAVNPDAALSEQAGSGAVLLAEAAAPSPGGDALSSLLEPEGQIFAPMCNSFCNLTGAHAHSGTPFDDAPVPGLLITPHGPSPTGGEAPLVSPADHIEGQNPSARLAPSAPVSHSGDTLLLEDLLELSPPDLFHARPAPAFESLLDPPAGPGAPPPPVADCLILAESPDAAQDPLLLALYGLGSL